MLAEQELGIWMYVLWDVVVFVFNLGSYRGGARLDGWDGNWSGGELDGR